MTDGNDHLIQQVSSNEETGVVDFEPIDLSFITDEFCHDMMHDDEYRDDCKFCFWQQFSSIARRLAMNISDAGKLCASFAIHPRQNLLDERWYPGCGRPAPVVTIGERDRGDSALEFVRELAGEDCEYGDNCPVFGSRHGACLYCKARRALEYDDA